MTTDIARFEANERVDLADFAFVVDESMRAQSRHWADQFIRDPARDGPSWIIEGFDISYSGSDLKVTKGRAILGHREAGEVFYGSLTTEGPIERIVDVSTFSNSTYNVYVRFELIEGESASRAFWNPAGDGSEFAQTIPTRRLANWSVRVELTSPGAEWLKIGEAVVSGGAVTGVTEQRDFFFEGEEHNSFASQWSSDGGGSANDRNANRETVGVKSLHTFTAAMRQCVEDIKGRGLRRWWDRDIGGMNIGFNADPVEDRLAVGDALFYLDWQDSNNVFLHWDGSEGYFKYDRVTPQLQLTIDSAVAFRADDTGIRARGIAVRDNTGDTPVVDQISCGFSSFRMEYDSATGDKYLRFDGTQTYFHFDDSEDELILKVGGGTPWKAYLNGIRMRGLAVSNGLGVAHVTDRVTVGDTNFFMDWDGTNPFLQWDADDYFKFTRSSNELTCVVNTTNAWLTDVNGFRTRGLAISTGLTVLPSIDAIRIGNQYFELIWNGADAFVRFDTNNDYFKYDRSENRLGLYIGDSVNVRHNWWAAKAYIEGTSGDPTSELSVSGQYTYAQDSGMLVIHGPANSGGADVLEQKALNATLDRETLGDTATSSTAGQTFFYDTTFNLGQVAAKVFRLVAWGTVKQLAGGATNFNIGVTITDGTTSDTLGIMTFQPLAGSGLAHNSRDKWKIEVLIPVRAESSSEVIHGQFTGSYSIGGTVTWQLSHEEASALALDANNFRVRAWVQTPTVGDQHTFDVCCAFIEEMGGEAN